MVGREPQTVRGTEGERAVKAGRTPPGADGPHVWCAARAVRIACQAAGLHSDGIAKGAGGVAGLRRARPFTSPTVSGLDRVGQARRDETSTFDRGDSPP